MKSPSSHYTDEETEAQRKQGREGGKDLSLVTHILRSRAGAGTLSS